MLKTDEKDRILYNLSWITEINELFHDILIYWDAPVVQSKTLVIKQL